MSNRFVVQEHTTAEGVHWDLMLEKGGVLMTFRLPEPPRNALDHAIRTVRTFDHALKFLTYEGPVQKGAGKVRIVDRGTFYLQDETDDLIALELQGIILHGGFTLTRTKGVSWELARGE